VDARLGLAKQLAVGGRLGREGGKAGRGKEGNAGAGAVGSGSGRAEGAGGATRPEKLAKGLLGEAEEEAEEEAGAYVWQAQ
jgi:hypothetical protein